MRNSKKIAAAAGVLWSFALLGGGATQAFGQDSSGNSATCVDDGKGHTSCAQESVYRDKDGKVQVVAKQTQECGGGNCDSRVQFGGKQS